MDYINIDKKFNNLSHTDRTILLGYKHINLVEVDLNENEYAVIKTDGISKWFRYSKNTVSDIGINDFSFYIKKEKNKYTLFINIEPLKLKCALSHFLSTTEIEYWIQTPFYIRITDSAIKTASVATIYNSLLFTALQKDNDWNSHNYNKIGIYKLLNHSDCPPWEWDEEAFTLCAKKIINYLFLSDKSHLICYILKALEFRYSITEILLMLKRDNSYLFS